MSGEIKQLFHKEIRSVFAGKPISIPYFQKLYQISYDDAAQLYRALNEAWAIEKEKKDNIS